MITQQQALELYNLLSKAQVSSWNEDRLHFEFSSVFQEDIDALSHLAETADLDGDEPSNALIGHSYKFSIRETYYIFQSFENALKRTDIRVGDFERFIYWDSIQNKPHIFERHALSNEMNGNNTVPSYIQMLKIIDTLSRLADRNELKNSSCLYFHYDKNDIIFNCNYHKKLLKQMAIDCSKHTIKKMQTEFAILDNDKKRIFKQVLWLMWKGHNDSCNAFEVFILELPAFFHRYEIEFELFITKFSFENLKNKIDSEIKALSFQMDECLVGMQGKIIAIPIAEAFMILQMEVENQERNITLFLIGILASILMWRFLNLQKNNLEYIAAIIEERKTELNEIPKTSQEILQKFQKLSDRIEQHFSFIKTIRLIILVANFMGLIFVMWYAYGTHVNEWFVWLFLWASY